MSRPIFEVIALGVVDAVAAESGGADRLELVSGMSAGGLTPSRETFAAVRAAVRVPIRVMLRARDGYEADDLDALCARAAALRREGADEFVLGFLDRSSDGPDLKAVHALLDAIGPDSRWTFHRAIDHTPDRVALRAALRGSPGLDTYLTAGSSDGVDAGLPVLLAEAALPPGEPRLLVGGGLRADHLPALLAGGIDAFHVGGAVRPAGWAGPVDAAAVRAWRDVLDAPVGVA
jgi:copper homeostasis protein